MALIKAYQVAAATARPDPRYRAFLLYGPDPALVAERAAELAKALAGATSPAGEILRIDDRDLAERPDRIAVEARSLSMFSARSVLRIRAGARLNADDLEALISQTLEAVLVVEAGNLNAKARLRTLFEKHAHGLAMPCYPESDRDLTRTIERLAREWGISLSREAHALLLAKASGDPGAARAEIEKLSLYAGKDKSISVDDVEAVSGDWAQAALDTLSIATSGGNTTAALAELDRVVSSGQGAQGAIAALARQFERLHRLACASEAGTPVKSALAAFRPPLHFRMKDALERDTGKWPRTRAAAALLAISEGAVRARRLPDFDRQIAERLIVNLSATRR
ncbi:MAG: DNA polymerase III subunit delta [Pseudomonadota bacterium]|nr:DNA polymerase III subunit delta [Pseudomonadota bacterium]